MLRLEEAEIAQDTFTLRADLSIEQTRKYAVIGPSGAGKSTLLFADLSPSARVGYSGRTPTSRRLPPVTGP